MRTISIGCTVVAAAALAVFMNPTLAAAQGQKVPERPHLNDPGYYDRDGAEDAPKAKKLREESQAKAAAQMKEALARPIPRTPDGHVDLNGIWIPTGNGLLVVISEDGKSRKVLFGPFPEGKPGPVVSPIPKGAPTYKTEYQAKVEDMWINQTKVDPTHYLCKNPGVPRIGIPDMIVQSPGQVVLLYKQGLAGGNPVSTFRIIPTDGRPHRADADPSVFGDSVGHFEKDTLVIDVTRFDDSTWFERYGDFHTESMHVVERLTRKGNTLEYTATVEDPIVLTKPWTSNPTIRVLGGPQDLPYNDVPCVDNDSQHLTGLEHF